MTKYIKYNRFTEEFNNKEDIQEFLDMLITDGWEIIYWNEAPKTVVILSIIVLAGKRRTDVL